MADGHGDVAKKPALPDHVSATYQEFRDRRHALREEYSARRKAAMRQARLEALDTVSATAAERNQMIELWDEVDQANADVIHRSVPESLSRDQVGKEFIANLEARTEQEERVLGRSRSDQYAEALDRLYETMVRPIEDERDRLLDELEEEAQDQGVTTEPLPPGSPMPGH